MQNNCIQSAFRPVCEVSHRTSVVLGSVGCTACIDPTICIDLCRHIQILMTQHMCVAMTTLNLVGY